MLEHPAAHFPAPADLLALPAPGLALLDAVRTYAGDLRGVAKTHGFWMGWNLLLAFVPVVLSLLLFRRGAHRTMFWWAGVVVWLLFLPNAPYVLTDVVHLFRDIRSARSDLQVLGLYLPVYLSFFLVGFGCYVASLERARRYVRAVCPAWRWWPMEATIHLLCAVGIYLGRVVRLNSWHVFTRPREVISSVDWLVGAFPFVIIAITFVVLVLGTTVMRAILATSMSWARQHWRLSAS